ncbi:MAG: hypothetical protein RL481_612, partial [Pseudomonadota bacterium]
MTLRRPANFRLRLVIEWLVIATLSSLAVVLASQWRGTAAFDNLFYDQLTSFARPAADPKTLIVMIDDSSLSALGQWPWPRSTHAALIDKIQQAAPRSILFDVLVSETSDEADDGALAAAMKTGAPVYVPLHFVSPGTNGKAFDVMPPIEILGSAASGTGHVNVEFDSDGVVRRAMLCFSPDELGGRYPHIVELVARNDGKPTPAYTRNDSCNRAVLIPYSKRGSFIEIPFVNVLNGEIPA